MRAQVAVMFALAVACSNREHSAPARNSAEAVQHEMTLLNRAGNPRVTLTNKLDLVDAEGRAVGRFNANDHEVTVNEVHQTLDGVMFIDGRHLELRLSLGTLEVDVKGNEIWVNDQLFGGIAGLPDTRDGMRGLGVLVIAALVLPPATPRDAPRVDARIEEPPIPPPPPHP